MGTTIMATRQANNRVILYKRLKTITPKGGTHMWSLTPGPILGSDVGLDEFTNEYFGNQQEFEKLYYKLTKTITSDDSFAVDPQENSIEDFYSWFACDLEWASGVEACANAAKADEVKNLFPGCVQSIGKIVNSANGTPYIDGTGRYVGLRFSNNGGVINIRTKTKGTYTCDEQNTVVINMEQAASQNSVQSTQPEQPQQAQPVQPQPEQPKQQTQNPQRPNLTFHECQGTYTPGCVNTDAIAQVQRCLDLTTPRHPRGSGYYDYILQDKLASMGYEKGFTDADVSKICSMDATKTKPFQAQENDVPGEETESPRQTYEKYYAKLDGKETNRVKLKLSNIPDSDLTNLNKYFATQGLYKIINPKRRYGTKFVWGKKPS